MTDRGPWLQTFTGRAFYPLDPRADEVHIEDIAHSLAYQCRFGGHSRFFYSVGEHSVRASYLVKPALAMQALLHDASEAYANDIPRPLKRVLPDYRALELNIAGAIGERFGVELCNLPSDVHMADAIMLATERRDLMAPSSVEWEAMPRPDAGTIYPKQPTDAEQLFLKRFEQLGGRL